MWRCFGVGGLVHDQNVLDGLFFSEWYTVIMRKAIAYGVAGTLLLALAALNIYASQVNYNSLMFRLIQLKDVEAAREYLANVKDAKNIKAVPSASGLDGDLDSSLYDMQSRYLNSHFDNIFAREVNINRLNAEKAIFRYEELLAISPQNPEILMKLALLYREKGDDQLANAYYQRAISIDPWIDVKGF